MITNVYVDTFNLYYGLLKGSPYRWLDIRQLCQTELPSNQLNRIRCFSARVIARPGDPDQRNRQNAYFRALETTPHLTMHLGHFLESEVSMRRVAAVLPQSPRQWLAGFRGREEGWLHSLIW